MSALLDKGVFPTEFPIDILPTEAAESVVDGAGGSSSRVPVSDRATPVTVAGREVGPPFSMPKFDPVSFSSGASPEGRLDWRVKICLARLHWMLRRGRWI